MSTLDALRQRLGNTRLLSFALDDGIPVGDDPASNTRWHQIALEGEWEGHWQGPFSLTRRDFEQIVLNAKAQQTDTLVDYEHSSLRLFFGGKAEAAGWSPDLQIRDADDGSARLFARIGWTDVAAAHIRQREYRYLSPAIAWKTRDRKTGTELGASLVSVGLTNQPFLEELPEVTLNSILAGVAPVELSTSGATAMNELKQLALAAGLPESSTAEAISDAITSLGTRVQAYGGVLDALELSADTTVDTVVTTVKALRARPDETEVEGLRTEVRAMRADTLVDAATKEGKIVASNRDWARKLAASSPEGFADWAASAPKVVPLTQPKAPAQSREAIDDAAIDAEIAALSADERQGCDDTGLSYQSYARMKLSDQQGA